MHPKTRQWHDAQPLPHRESVVAWRAFPPRQRAPLFLWNLFSGFSRQPRLRPSRSQCLGGTPVFPLLFPMMLRQGWLQGGGVTPPPPNVAD